VEIPDDPEAPWTGTVVGGDLDEAVERMTHHYRKPGHIHRQPVPGGPGRCPMVVGGWRQ
jgi:hypothetical protein